MTSTTVTPRPPGFVTYLVYQETHPGHDWPYTVLDDLEFFDGVFRLIVPAGFRYDRASIPKILQRIVGKELLEYAAAVHDYLYRLGYDKDVADRIFYLIARSNGKIDRFRARMAWRFVQVGGWPSWLRSKRRASMSMA